MNIQVDFYKKYQISPVDQDIADLKKHFEKREFLYRRLGVVGSFIRNKSVIEFGPGSGHNSLYTLACSPSRYVLVDANPTGLKGCQELFRKYFPDRRSFELAVGFIEKYKSDQLFDLVLCEGLLHAQKKPDQCLKSVAKFTKPGGVCVISTQDCIGYLSELLRALIGGIVIKEDMSFEENIKTLVETFEGHFAHLKGMSRSPQDWIVDNLMNKAYWGNAGSDYLSIESAIRVLDASFDVYGVSPYFFVDWRWYKDVYGENRNFNKVAVDCYRKNLHNLLDFRCVWGPRAAEENRDLLRICIEIRRLVARFAHEKNGSHIEIISQKIHELEEMVRTFSEITADALSDFNSALGKYPAITRKTDWKSFSSWWGRGTQYLSFIRNTNEENLKD